MAFGFPAYHTEVTSAFADIDNVEELILDALYSLGWSAGESRRRISASTGISFWSWGETIDVKRQRDGVLTITSQCAMPTQCLDWGKNRRNVSKLIAELHRLAENCDEEENVPRPRVLDDADLRDTDRIRRRRDD